MLLYFNLLLVALLLLSYLSVHVSPAKFWPAAFLGLAYPYLLFFNLMFCLFWLYFRKRAFLISLLAMILGWHFITNHFQVHLKSGSRKGAVVAAGRPGRQQNHQLKVMSFNIRAFNLYNWTRDRTSLDRIIDFIRKEDPDLICLQEFYVGSRDSTGLQYIVDRLDRTPYRHVHYTSGGHAANAYGIVTFSAYPIINRGYISFEHTLNISIYTDIVFREDTVRIYNNHLQSIHLKDRKYVYLDSLRLRDNEKQVEELMDISHRLRDAFVKRSLQAVEIARHLNQDPYPVILCGDFNDTPSSYTYYKIRDGMSDAFVEAGSGFGNTYAGKFPSFRIDYILHAPELDAVYFKRIRTPLSDHYPIIAGLRID